MKKIIIVLFVIFLTCGCGKSKKVECILNNEKDENMKSYMRVTLFTNGDTVEKEKLYAVYKFKSEKVATDNYSKVEKIIEQDDSIKLVQNKENIIAKGEKDLKSMQYDKDSKVKYYEQLGYTCK